MSVLLVRRLLVDLEAPIARHWCAEDPFRTALFNALSMSFPVGEQFFMDAVRAAFKALPADRQARLRSDVQGFVGQEAVHRRMHGLFNAHLERQGLVNTWGPRAHKRAQRLQGLDARHALAATAAYEHFTAVLAEWLLQNPEVLGPDERLARLWLWHGAEEAEHKGVAFDLYQALDGNYAWRMTWFWRVSWVFLSDLARQTVANLRQDGTLWRWRTWKSAARYLLGPQGLLRQTFGPWRDYLRRDFHPSQHDSAASQAWLLANQDHYVGVGETPLSA